MNVLFLTRTDTMKLTGGIWFRQCRCFFNHKKNTDPFVIVGSSFFSHWRLVCMKIKNHDAPKNKISFLVTDFGLFPPIIFSCSFGKTRFFCIGVWFWPNLVLSSNSCMQRLFTRFSFDYADHCHRVSTTSLSQWQTSNLIKTHLTLTHPRTLHTFQLPSLHSKFSRVFCPRPGSFLGFSRWALISKRFKARWWTPWLK